ncbi:hypothetical protein [Lysinibacillus sphaericus]|uniref:hypothetical protein n=1 Tax=Lysinibacillus sphaericus TaxID=1421 RepID=UPI0018CFCBEB|nr:hypothetical protein [Lysinibacillus sphaericus]
MQKIKLMKKTVGSSFELIDIEHIPLMDDHSNEEEVTNFWDEQMDKLVFGIDEVQNLPEQHAIILLPQQDAVVVYDRHSTEPLNMLILNHAVRGDFYVYCVEDSEPKSITVPTQAYFNNLIVNWEDFQSKIQEKQTDLQNAIFRKAYELGYEDGGETVQIVVKEYGDKLAYAVEMPRTSNELLMLQFIATRTEPTTDLSSSIHLTSLNLSSQLSNEVQWVYNDGLRISESAKIQNKPTFSYKGENVYGTVLVVRYDKNGELIDLNEPIVPYNFMLGCNFVNQSICIADEIDDIEILELNKEEFLDFLSKFFNQ